MSPWAAVALGAAFGAVLACGAGGTFVARRRRALSAPLHELRGALAAIQLGLFALERRGPVAGLGAEALRTQAERAHVAVEDIDAIRSPGRHAPQRLELIEVGALIRRRVAAWSRLAEVRRRSVELRWAIGPAVVRVDPDRLGQALDNLIVNALDHGGGIVRVSGALRERTLRISVSDQGPGLGRSLDELSRPAWNERHGHGLAVAARAAELHGGRLVASSGRFGSRIEIELPLAERAVDDPRPTLVAKRVLESAT